MMWNGASWWWLVGGLWMLLFWGGIIALAVWAVLRFSRPREKPPTPLDVLKMRYARGEIAREEFEQRKAGLLS